MKYAFLVTVAAFAFLISCGKKDKKQGQVGKTTAAQLDCKGKDKDNKTCTPAAKGEISSGDEIKESGVSAKEAKTEMETIPNVYDEELTDIKKSKMGIGLSNDTSLLAEVKVNAESDNMTNTRFFCGDIGNIAKLTKDSVLADPDDLKTAVVELYLFGKSSIVTNLKVNKGDKTDPTKWYMLTCNGAYSANVSSFKSESISKDYEVRELKSGQVAFEMIVMNKNVSTGMLTSFECGNDDDVLKDKVRKIGKDKLNKSLNRFRLRKGSSVLVYRAYESKESDKKLNELGSDKQKEQKYSVISCG